jgi:hypothetical protein
MRMPKMENKITPSASQKPPLLKNWNWWYLIVLANLTVLILFFYLLSKIFE